MNDIFTNFNSGIIKKIHDFINSPKDLIYVSGFQGSGKSEIVEKATRKIDDDILLFRHLCFENSVIDDFLLGFYDTFRQYSIDKKIVLKKSLTENFAQKVSFYFKKLDKKSLIIIDNFEIISKSSEILDFLAHLGKYKNVKLILVSRVLNLDFFETKGLQTEVIDIPPNTEQIFRQKVLSSLIDADEDDIKALFNASKGYELYLKMTTRYIKIVNITLKEFMGEYKKRKSDFGGFMLAKIVSLVPDIYYGMLQNLSCLNHCVSPDFIGSYGLGDTSHIDYLYKKLLISKFSDEIYMKDYLKEYFLNTLTIQDKVNHYRKLINIYENELTKSPKDRLLRLSRESIRKQIEYIKTKIPEQNQGAGLKRPNFTYISQSQNLPGAWMLNQKLIQKTFKTPASNMPKNTQVNEPKKNLEPSLSDEEKLLIKNFREKKNVIEETTASPYTPKDTNTFIKEADAFEVNYNYAKAIEVLLEADKNNANKDITPSILIKLAKNNLKINNFETALNYYETACDMYKKQGKTQEYFNLRLNIANHYKELYRFDKSKKYYSEVINAKSTATNNALSRGYLGLGEIEEMENNFTTALENYQNAIAAIKGIDSEKTILCEIYFKTALLYDDKQDGQNALQYYKMNIETSNDSHINKQLSLAYSNAAILCADIGQRNEAVEYFIEAFEVDKKENNTEGIYFSSRQLAEIYKDSDPEISLQYLEYALNCAKELDDSFKIALSSIDTGDYYYNKRENKKALEYFMEAKKMLGESISKENAERIAVRINDMQVKMDENEFGEIIKKYEQ